MPRKNPNLKFTRAGRGGRLAYFRRIPIVLRNLFDGKATFARDLGGTSAELDDPALLRRYTEIHREYENRLEKARAAQQPGSSQLVKQDLSPPWASFPLSRKDIAGITGAALQNVVKLTEVNDGPPEIGYAKEVAPLVTLIERQPLHQQKLIWACLASLFEAFEHGVYPTEADWMRMIRQVQVYLPDVKTDLDAIVQGDYGKSQLKSKAPAPPERIKDWNELLGAWREEQGGVLERDGYGVSEERIKAYRIMIRDLTCAVPGVSPVAFSYEDGLTFLDWLSQRSLALRTRQNRLACLKALMKVAERRRWIQANPVSALTLKTPKGLNDEEGYRPLTPQELRVVFQKLRRDPLIQYSLGFELLLKTGARLDEVRTLRCSDFKQTASGLWYIDWVHQPTADLPMKLKGRAGNERQFPVPLDLLEPLLEQRKAARQQAAGDARLWGPGKLSSGSAWSKKFGQILKSTSVYEAGETAAHSLRNSFLDLAREAGIPFDIRHAATGHAEKTVQDKSYGVGLRKMPERLHEEMQKIDWSFLD